MELHGIDDTFESILDDVMIQCIGAHTIYGSKAGVGVAVVI